MPVARMLSLSPHLAIGFDPDGEAAIQWRGPAPAPAPEAVGQMVHAAREEMLRQVAHLTLWMEAASSERRVVVPSRPSILVPGL